MAYLHHVLTVCNFLAFLLVLSPLPWHIQSWNTGTCFYMFWCALGCLIHFINAIVYDGTLEVQSAIWCEMSGRLGAATSYGIPAAVLCINRRLFIISRGGSHQTPSRRKMVIADIAIAVLIPAVLTCLISLPQGHRSDLLEDIGCLQPYYNTVPAIMIQGLPPLLIGLASGVYGVLNVRVLYSRQSELKRLLSAGNITIDFSEYYRLFCLGTIDAIFTIPLATWTMYTLMTHTPFRPWIWADVKLNYNSIWLLPRPYWESYSSVQFKVGQWFNVLCALVFFAFFGCSKEARARYRRVILWTIKPIYKPKPPPQIQFKDDAPSRRVNRKPDTLDMSFNSSVTTFATSQQTNESAQDVAPHFTFGSFSVENLGFHWSPSAASIPPVPPLPAHLVDNVDNSSQRKSRILSRVSETRVAQALRAMIAKNGSASSSSTFKQSEEEKSIQRVV
ncbi:hypothetical protein CCMSSC00406_0008989 [Pleurotus cornucopiae]|uniref:Uncharacterized protein n=1 Tax=Pleurotus cornucopiae TaxID=5321 RepID=A0ACB7J8V2_PLECO|nr:hypothetical protein CCMSSC00406_0008989 [Pleurotus cornucopiae]